MRSLLRSIFLLLILSISAAYSQKPNKSVEVKAQNNIYVYKGLGTGSHPLVAVHRKNSIPSIYAAKDLRPTLLSYIKYTSEKPISKSVYEVFDTNRLKKLRTEVIVAHMYMNSLGKVIAIKYFVKIKTKLTPAELERLEDALKKNVSLIIPKDYKANGPIAPSVQSIHVQKILNKTFPY